MRRFQTILVVALLRVIFCPFAQAQNAPRVSGDRPPRSERPRRQSSDLRSRFTAAQRAQIARELAQNALRASEDARKAAPVTAARGTPDAARQQDHQTHLGILLNRKYDRQTCARYRITFDDIVAINRESIDRGIHQR